MPATFPSHAAVVLPLKMWRPRWFDGVALVVGSTSPDLLYAVSGLVYRPVMHDLAGLFLFCLPVTLMLTWVVRRVAPTVAVHLPEGGLFAWRDYGVLGAVRHRWYVVGWSALLGAASHMGWDAFTHPGGSGTFHVPLAILDQLVAGRPVWWLLQQASTVVGAVVTVWLAGVIGRHHLLRRWHGAPPAVPARPGAFWGTVLAVAGLYLVTLPLLPYAWHAYVQGVRALWAAGAALVAGALAVRLSTRYRTAERPAA